MSEAKVAAIHQPNFFPWPGYFDKIRRCDRFVVLDDALIPKTGGSWCNRVGIDINGRKSWLTAPLQRAHGRQEIRAARFQDSGWREKVARTLQAAYGGAPCFKQHKEALLSLVAFPSNSLLEYNLNAIAGLCPLFGLDFRAKAVLASELKVEATATERLVRLTRAVGCSAYLCGGGAGGYQDDELFAREGLRLIYQDFVPQPYPQLRARRFIPGLSILDYLFNKGAVPW